jgi:sulfur carrier protein
MIITLNGSKCEIAEGTTVADLITDITGSARGSAAVVDGEVLPRSIWPLTELREGQQIELITAVQGG